MEMLAQLRRWVQHGAGAGLGKLRKPCQGERRRSNGMLLSLATLRPAIGAGILPNRSGAWLAQRDQTIPRTRLIDAMRSDRFRSALLPPFARASRPAAGGLERPPAAVSAPLPTGTMARR